MEGEKHTTKNVLYTCLGKKRKGLLTTPEGWVAPWGGFEMKGIIVLYGVLDAVAHRPNSQKNHTIMDNRWNYHDYSGVCTSAYRASVEAVGTTAATPSERGP